MATTIDRDEMLAHARMQPGVADVMRLYEKSQHAMAPMQAQRPSSRIVFSTGANRSL
ncbi:hypothetical protein ACTJI8_12725 [Microbacterium sp. 22303]|uniref:hypothetical protein n=1 Tax=Microbacterium sp. 22303 TaxID=3453905 RepID=UPI003F875E1F